MWLSRVFLFWLCAVAWRHLARGDEHNHKYKDDEEVVLWMNTVGPYDNQQEKYAYFSLPFCAGPATHSRYQKTLSDALQGVELQYSGYEMAFKTNDSPVIVCMIQLSETGLRAFTEAVMNDYWYQMYIDGLPIWGKVGERDKREDKYYIYKHKRLDIGYNGQRIVDINLTTSGKELLMPQAKIRFSYEVNWKPSNVPFKNRFDKYNEPGFPQNRIHWFSIFNSFMTVLFLVGFVSMILIRTLRKDYARYSKDGEMDNMKRNLGDEFGWKQAHGDVFRSPSNALVFSAMVGAGYQFISVVFCVLMFTVVGELYTGRDSMLSTAIIVHAATSPINGYFGGSLYARLGGQLWIRQMLTSAFMVPVFVCGTAFWLLSFETMLTATCICFFVILPLTLVGTLVGRKLNGQPQQPCSVYVVPHLSKPPPTCSSIVAAVGPVIDSKETVEIVHSPKAEPVVLGAAAPTTHHPTAVNGSSEDHGPSPTTTR